jgi:hypothetical protein
VPDNVGFIVLITSACVDDTHPTARKGVKWPHYWTKGASSPHSGNRVFDGKALGIERESHPNVRVGIPACHEVRDLSDALSLDRHPESGTPTANLHRNLYHLAHSDSSLKLAYLSVWSYE